ncbi:MAG: hypothetical protein LC713_06130, partial [Actinobacteria bacterium]|nr:hypothetical protein [Actinomycetota bacterium]
AQGLVAATGPTGSIDVRAQLADGRLLGGTVPGLSADTLLTVTYSRVAPKHRMTSWIRLLALTAANPERAFEAATVGRVGKSSVTIARIPPLGKTRAERRDAALIHLATLMDLYDRGMCEPLSLYCATSAAYAEAVKTGADQVKASSEAWTSKYNFDKEDTELEHQLVLGGVLTIEELLDERPRADEHGAGWDITDASRLGRYARRMWDGLLACEQVTRA